ncbi:potassium channel family protein [Vibrio sp. Of7-15]|uniref:potassium channel family protein n=1 Tax=Vibrio sp. Of7-15 TaxID=2724879 RepID=UPI001EF20BF4|nr:potassium channel family protein [Vibrio sp. Of7-15]MCG7498214.1 potassium channel family protein [Vibrio sp. Of7-15]
MALYNNRTDLKPMGLMSLILSFISIIIITGLLFAPLSSASRQLLISIDTFICLLFLLQLFIDLMRSSNKVAYFKQHWIDILASIPIIEPLRYARIFHILRLLRLIRSGTLLVQQIQHNRREATIASIFLLLILLLTTGSGLMLIIEGNVPEANIQSAGDALWWSFVTISTVGYGDHYPVTSAGKILAAVIIICGVGMFGMISGLISSLITEPSRKEKSHQEAQLHQEKEQQWKLLLTQQQLLLDRIASLEEKLEQQKKPDSQ